VPSVAGHDLDRDAVPAQRQRGAVGGEDAEAEVGERMIGEDRAPACPGWRSRRTPSRGRQRTVRGRLGLRERRAERGVEPITSPVERISGPSTVSTPDPSVRRNRWNGSTASLTATGASAGQVAAVAGGRQQALLAQLPTVAPSAIRAAALASGTAVAWTRTAPYATPAGSPREPTARRP
jgi:hypothetical protein